MDKTITYLITIQRLAMSEETNTSFKENVIVNELITNKQVNNILRILVDKN